MTHYKHTSGIVEVLRASALSQELKVLLDEVTREFVQALLEAVENITTGDSTCDGFVVTAVTSLLQTLLKSPTAICSGPILLSGRSP
jgi:hypothetical protein